MSEVRALYTLFDYIILP